GEAARTARVDRQAGQRPPVHEGTELVGELEPAAQEPSARAAPVADVDEAAAPAAFGERVELGECSRADDGGAEPLEVGERERPLRPIDAGQHLAPRRDANGRAPAALGARTEAEHRAHDGLRANSDRPRPEEPPE